MNGFVKALVAVVIVFLTLVVSNILIQTGVGALWTVFVMFGGFYAVRAIYKSGPNKKTASDIKTPE